jgi:hypothetical protein
MRFWGSAAIIVPGWLATFWFLPDLRVLATVSLLVGAWLMAHAYRRLPRPASRQRREEPCAAFEILRLSRERDFYRSFPQRLLPAILAGQVAIVATLLTNPRFEKTPQFGVWLSLFVITVIVALAVIYRHSRSVAGELDRELALLEQAVKS